jgi:RimJ/RimL family protein N-acetyltransferase
MRLANGSPALVRPIRPEDGAALRRGLKRLSPEGLVFRFLHERQDFTDQELYYLTHCDMVDHVGMILAILDEDGREIDQVGVARWVRDKADPTLAEVAIVLVDEWQHQGGGQFLLRTLASAAWQGGIRRWQAFSFAENTAIHRLLDKVGTLAYERRLGHGTIELGYDLTEPAKSS